MQLDAFRASLETWLDDHASELAPDFDGTGTLDQQVAQLDKVKRLIFDDGWMRWGWPERVGGLGGSPLLRASLAEALVARDLVEPGLYSLVEVLAPTMIDYASRISPREWCPGSCGERRPGARGSPSPGPGATSRRSRAGRRGTATAGGSAVRSSGPVSPSTPIAACSSPAPDRPNPRTGGSPPSSSTWTAPASRCGRCRPCTASRSSARSSSTRWRCHSNGPWARWGRGGRWRWTCSPSNAAPPSGRGAPTSTGASSSW